MAADYTRTIVFKVEDKAIKSALNRITDSLEKIDKTLKRIEQKGFSKIGKEADKAAKSIDKVTNSTSKLQQIQQAIQGRGNKVAVGAAGLGLGTAAAIKGWNNLAGSINNVLSPLTALVPAVKAPTIALGGFGAVGKAAAIVAGSKLTPVLGALAVAYMALGDKTLPIIKKTTGLINGFGQLAITAGSQLTKGLNQAALSFAPLRTEIEWTTQALLKLDKRFKTPRGLITSRNRAFGIRQEGTSIEEQVRMRNRRINEKMATDRQARYDKAVKERRFLAPGLHSEKASLALQKEKTKELRKQLELTKKQAKAMFTPEARADRRQGARRRARVSGVRRAAGRVGMGGITGKGAESLMLGAGFPMLFGGGAGAVGGSLAGAGIGNMLGLGGFGAQILGSALGTMLENVHNRVVEIGKATQTLNLDALEQSGIRVNAQLELQIRKLKRIGDYKGAQEALDEQVFCTTGGSGEMSRDIALGVGALKESWDGFLAAAGTSLGIIFTPIVYALTAILKLVQGILFVINAIVGFILGGLKDGVQWLLKMLPGGEDLIKNIEASMLGLSGTLDDIKVKYGEMMQDLEKEKEAILLKIRYGEKEAAIRQRIADLQHLTTNDTEKAALENSIRQIALLNEQLEAQRKVEQMYQRIGETIKNGLVDALDNAIHKTKTLGEIASSVLRSVTRMLLQFGVQSALGAAFGGTSFGNFLGVTAPVSRNQTQNNASTGQSGPVDARGQGFTGAIQGVSGFVPQIRLQGAATGGPVKGGTPYLVGERGMELFTPHTSGYITPNHALGGSSIVVNVDASGTSVEGDDSGGRALGEMLAVAIQSELIKQKRPGGILT